MERITPDIVTTLKENEVFVFGSNLSGLHYGGAAYIALRDFGAIFGKGVGIQGRSYALPTLYADENNVLGQLPLKIIESYVRDFIEYAKVHTELTFLVTPIGCGIAGFYPSEIAPFFKECIDMENVYLPKSFL